MKSDEDGMVGTCADSYRVSGVDPFSESRMFLEIR